MTQEEFEKAEAEGKTALFMEYVQDGQDKISVGGRGNARLLINAAATGIVALAWMMEEAVGRIFSLARLMVRARRKEGRK